MNFYIKWAIFIALFINIQVYDDKENLNPSKNFVLMRLI